MVDERSNVVPLWMAVVRDAVEKFKAASAEEQDVICVELGQKCGTKAAERKARELFAAARPKPELQYKKVDRRVVLLDCWWRLEKVDWTAAEASSC